MGINSGFKGLINSVKLREKVQQDGHFS